MKLDSNASIFVANMLPPKEAVLFLSCCKALYSDVHRYRCSELLTESDAFSISLFTDERKTSSVKGNRLLRFQVLNFSFDTNLPFQQRFIGCDIRHIQKLRIGSCCKTINEEAVKMMSELRELTVEGNIKFSDRVPFPSGLTSLTLRPQDTTKLSIEEKNIQLPVGLKYLHMAHIDPSEFNPRRRCSPLYHNLICSLPSGLTYLNLRLTDVEEDIVFPLALKTLLIRYSNNTKTHYLDDPIGNKNVLNVPLSITTLECTSSNLLLSILPNLKSLHTLILWKCNFSPAGEDSFERVKRYSESLGVTVEDKGRLPFGLGIKSIIVDEDL